MELTTPHESLRYRDRIYGRYVSAFKGRPPDGRLESDFEHRATFLDHLFKPLLDQAMPEKILEVGCGQGPFLFWTQQRGFTSARGFDLCREQVEVARSIGLAAEVACAEDYLEGCDRDFDLIVAMDVIEHFTRDEALHFLDQSYSCLRPGGHLFLTTPNGSALRPGPVVHGDLTHETVFSPRTIRLALQLSGYVDVEIREILPPPTSFRSRSRRALWKIARLGPMLLDLVETGAASGRVYSRVMAVQARKPR